MKILFLFFITSLLFCKNGLAQIELQVSKEEMEAVKTTTTICVLQNKEKNKLEEYRKAAELSWSFNEITFITEDELSKYLDKPGYSFITICGFVMDYGYLIGKSTSTAYSYYLQLWLPEPGKKAPKEQITVMYLEPLTSYKKKTIATTELYLDIRTSSKLFYGAYSKEEKHKLMMGDSANFYNLTPGYMKCYLSVLSKCLKEGRRRGKLQSEENKTYLNKLSTETLLVPDYLKVGNGMNSGKTIAYEELFKKYEFKYSIIGNDELSFKILNAKQPIYVLVYIYFSSQKIITVYEGLSGNMIYSSGEGNSQNGLNSGDIKELSKKIGTSKE